MSEPSTFTGMRMGLEAIVVIETAMDPAIGGTRMAPDGSVEECRRVRLPTCWPGVGVRAAMALRQWHQVTRRSSRRTAVSSAFRR